MTDSDMPAFGQMLFGIALTYGKDINDFTIAAFWGVLKSFEWTEVNKAFTAHLGDTDCGQYMPKPADIKRRIEGSSREIAMNALAKLEYAVRCCGPYKSVMFDDPIIPAVINDTGGWSRFSKITDNDYTFYKKDFLERYCAYLKKDQLPMPRPLLGLEALSNTSTGVNLPDPIIIGDEKKCTQLLIDIRNDGLKLKLKDK